MEADTNELVNRAKQDDNEAFCQLVRLHQASIRAYIARFIFDSDAVFDLAQETFITAHHRFYTFDTSAALFPWLRGIARTMSLQYLRKEGRRKRRETMAMEDSIMSWREQRLENDDVSQDIYISEMNVCIQQLPQSSAKILNMRYFMKHSIGDISRALGRKEGTIRMMLLRIRLALRKCIQIQVELQEETG